MLLISGTAEVELAWAQGRLATDDHRLTSVHGDAMVFSRIKHLVCYTHSFCFPVLLTCVIFFLTFIKSTVHWRRSRMWRGQVPQIWSGGANIDAPQSFCLYDTFIFLYNAAISFSLESYSAGDTELETYSWVWRETDQGNPLKCIHFMHTRRRGSSMLLCLGHSCLDPWRWNGSMSTVYYTLRHLPVHLCTSVLSLVVFF